MNPIPAVDFRPLLEATATECRARLDELFARGHFILGEQVRNFETELASALEAAGCVTVGNGTDALEVALREAGIDSPKQEVIAPALTAPFTGIGIAGSGARVRFADVDPETLLLDPADVAARVTKRTAAIVPVHLYGQPCDLGAITKIARQAGATVIQDACQAHGARHKGKPLTAYSPYVAYSFYPTKNLGALGDGGAVLTSSPARAKRMREFRDGGRRGGQVSFVKGINSRLDEMQACYLRAFLPHLAEWNAWRVKLAALYGEALAGCDAVRPVQTGPESVRHLYVVRAKKRDKLRAHLSARGIGAGIHYPVPLHVMPAFADSGLRRGDLPNAEKAAREIVSFPLYPYLEESAVLRVAEEIRRFY